MSKYLLGCFLFFSFYSCKNKANNPDILPEAKMRTVLWDVMRADEWVTEEYMKDSTINRYQRTMALYQKVFQVNKITADQFKRSFHYYQSHPDLLKPILDSIKQNAPAIVNPLEERKRPMQDAAL